jgi:hypothetical protein
MRIHKVEALPEALRETALGVAESGELRSGELCPACGGGRTGETSLSVIPDVPGFVNLKCWRAGCGYWAKVVTGGADTVLKAPSFRPRHLTRATFPPNAATRRRLREKYRLYTEAIDKFVLTTGTVLDRPEVLYMPVRSPTGGERGGVLRSLVHKESKNFKTTDEPFQAWYIPTVRSRFPGHREAQRDLVIVEDQLSAMRLWQLGIASVALLGTNLSRRKYREIMEVSGGGRPPILALDKDAFKGAVGYARKFGKITLALLERDIKDISDDEILERVG